MPCSHRRLSHSRHGSMKSSQNSQGVKDIVVEGSNNYYILSFARVLRRLLLQKLLIPKFNVPTDDV